MNSLLKLTLAVSLICPAAIAQTLPPGEFIFQPGSTSFPESHASTIVTLKNGDLMAAWFGGTKERAPDVAIWSSRRIDGKWSAPVELEREKGVPSWNPVLFHTKDGKLWLYYKVGPSPGTWAAGRMYSLDEGKTWSKDERLPAGLLGPIRAKPLILQDGTIVSGTSFEAHETWAAWVERSTDNGKTWAKIGPITISPEVDAAEPPAADPPAGAPGWAAPSKGPRKHVGIIQPSIISLGGKHLRMYARSRTLASKIAVADSMDDGVTWTQARFLDMPNNNSGHRCCAVERWTNRDDLQQHDHWKDAAESCGKQRWRALPDVCDTGGYRRAVLLSGDHPRGRWGLEMTYTWQRKTIKYVHLPLSAVPEP